MSQLKTTRTDQDVDAFLAGIADETKRADCQTLSRMMSAATGEPPALWGSAIVGFGSYRYRYASGHEGEWMRIGFSPRANNLTVYIMDGFDRYQELLDQLGTHKIGKSCLYVKRLSEIDLDVLTELIRRSAQQVGVGAPATSETSGDHRLGD